MADSDNSMTLSPVTRRRVLAGAAIAIGGWQRRAFATNDLEKHQSADPAVGVWRKWQAAREQTERLCRQQQLLERKLAETVGFPCATIRLRDGESVTLHSLKALRDVLDIGLEDATKRAAVEADFAAHQARWDAADREIGYTATLRAEFEAGFRADELLEALSETPATSLVGVAAKLDAVLREGQASKDDDEFPWPQIRSAFEDIDRIGRQKSVESECQREYPDIRSIADGKSRSSRHES